MAHWNGREVIYWPPRPSNRPGYHLEDCGCCAGVEWGGESQNECGSCKGDGWIEVEGSVE